MKKITCFLMGLVILSTSCSKKFLDTESPSQQSTEVTFNSTFLANNAMKGLYSILVVDGMYGNSITISYLNNSDIEFTALSSSFGRTSATGTATAQYYSNALTNYSSTWDNLFRLTEMSSTSISGIRNSAILTTSDSTAMKTFLGEALTLRALAYFELVKLWGDVPFRRELSSSANLYSPKCDRDTIYKYIISDLLEAENYLPWMGSTVGDVTYTAERVTKGFAKGLAARIALFAGGWSLRDGIMFPYQVTSLEHNSNIAELNGFFVGRVKNYKDYYAIAAKQCAEIIGSASNPHKLDDFTNLWKAVNALTSNTANENLLEVACGVNQSSYLGSSIGVYVAPGTTTYGARGFNGGYSKSTPYYFYSFDSLDLRRDVTLTNINYNVSTATSTGVEGEAFGNDFISGWQYAKWRYSWMNQTILDLQKSNTTDKIHTGINIIEMRYSDVLLMFAEAMNELNGADVANTTANMSARQALEKVRARAFTTHPERVSMYDADFFNAIVNERAWEFGGEGLRKYDLARWGLLSQKIEAQKKAWLAMLDNNKDIVAFDKIYPAGTLPQTIYFSYASDNKTINRSSINWYNNAAKTTAYSAPWLGKAVSATNYPKYATYIINESCGLNANYDEAEWGPLVSQLDNAATVKTALQASILANFNSSSSGNNVCNYRYLMAISNISISNSNSILVNSYGY